MKKLQKSDLKEGEIYKQLDFDYIFLYNKNETSDSFSDGTAISITSPRYCKRWAANGFEKDMIEATLEEKHWLETCINANEFVSYKEAMKTFKSEPEFVLPEKWCIATQDLTEIQLKKLSNYLNNLNNCNNRYIVSNIKQWSYIGSIKGSHLLPPTLNSLILNYNYTLINFERFEKYVLKEETPKVVAVEECKSKFIDNNTVETSEGSIFVVGDYVTPFESNSPNKGKKFKITGFRWNNTKTEICAITNLHKPYGIGVDKLELYIEPKPVKEESLLDKAKRLYPVGTKYKEFRGTVYTVNNQTFSQPEKNKIYGENNKGCLFIYDEWAEIVEYPHGFKVGDKIKLKNSEQRITHIINKIEGNVLFYEANNNYLTNHCRVLAKNAVKVK